MLTRIRNANLAKHRVVQIPYTKVTASIATLLLKEKLIENFKKFNAVSGKSLLLQLKYSKFDKTPIIKKLKRISKPSVRVYRSTKRMSQVLGGFGAAVVSTPLGVMTDREARINGIGGEILFYLW